MTLFDKYILKSFLQPLIATFFVVLFVLVMQALWLAFDEIAGKGIDILFILRFLGYLALTLTPMALPIGILLSSIMTLGNLSENYEFAAMKSAGLSLKRIIRPLVIMAVLLSGLNFIFLNNIYPWATLKQKNLYLNMKKKKPALAMVPGVFNTEIPGYSLKFDEKYGEEKNLLKNVQIADLSRKKGKNKVITAEKGIISTEEGSKYMTLTLENGNYYEEHIKKVLLSEDRAKMPASNATFDTYILNIDISSFDDSGKLDSLDVKEHHGMLSVLQLDSISKERKIDFDEYLERNSQKIYTSSKAHQLHEPHDSLRDAKLQPKVLDNFDLKNKSRILDNAIQRISSDVRFNRGQNKKFKDYRKLLNLYDFEFSYRISFALACLVLFFVGAPLGSIIRKGGFGLPMIMAIIIFVTYFFISQLGKNLAEESAISALFGSWLSTLILLPFGIILTLRAARGMGIFNIDLFFEGVIKFFKRVTKTS